MPGTAKLRAKAPSESAVEMRELVMPHQTNPQNTIFGGQIMAWIDMAAAMAAARHANCPVVTASVDGLSFVGPVKIGEHVCIKACVNYVGKTSIEVGVKVIRENPITGESRTTTTAYLTFVALDGYGKPTPVNPLEPQTKEEIRRYENAKIRSAERKRIHKLLKKAPQD